MPKRSCPFEDNLLPQLKIRVGEKQVDNGVAYEERMKGIYGRTLNLLKEGVKALENNLNNSMEMNLDDYKATFPIKPKQERHSKQRVLSNKLELLGNDKAIDDTRSKYDLCECTRVIERITCNKCFYCDQLLCDSCSIECCGCSELFCLNCMLPIYDDGEKYKCLNCYK